MRPLSFRINRVSHPIGQQNLNILSGHITEISMHGARGEATPNIDQTLSEVGW
jgi:hypothetical protein